MLGNCRCWSFRGTIVAGLRPGQWERNSQRADWCVSEFSQIAHRRRSDHVIDRGETCQPASDAERIHRQQQETNCPDSRYRV